MLQQPLIQGLQAVEAAAQHLLDRGRHCGGALATLLANRAHQLLDEERVALGLGGDGLEERGIERVRARRRPGQTEAVLSPQRLQRHLRGEGLVDPRRAIARAIRAHQDDARADQGVDQRGEVLLGRAIDPVDVLEQHDERTLSAAADRELTERLERPGLERLRVGLGEPLALDLHAEKLREHVALPRPPCSWPAWRPPA